MISPVDNKSDRDIALFAHLVAFFCLYLQRFGLAFAGGSHFFFATFAVPLVLLWLFTRGSMRIDRQTFIAYGWLVFSAAVATLAAFAFPDPRTSVSLTSLVSLIWLYAPFVAAPRATSSKQVALETILFHLRIIACCGLVQFALQFVGLKIFTFSEWVPALKPILLEIEGTYHTKIEAVSGSHFFKSNGFFLLEPSYFSQFMGAALLLELFVLGRIKYLPIYAAALLSAISGTGLLLVAAFLCLYFIISSKGRALVAVIILGGATAAAIAAMLLPIARSAFFDRFAEFGSDNSSAYYRFTSQFRLLDYLGLDPRILIGWGPGSGERFGSTFDFLYQVPSLTKALLEYGFLGLAAYLALIFTAGRDRVGAYTITLCLIWLQTGGNFFIQPTFLFVMMLLIVWRPVQQSSVEQATRGILSPTLRAPRRFLLQQNP